MAWLAPEIELTLLQAQMVYQQGNEEQALAALEQALKIGRPAGYVRVFDQSTGLDYFLHLAKKRGMCPADVDKILSAIEQRGGGKLKLHFVPGPCGTFEWNGYGGNG